MNCDLVGMMYFDASVIHFYFPIIITILLLFSFRCMVDVLMRYRTAQVCSDPRLAKLEFNPTRDSMLAIQKEWTLLSLGLPRCDVE